MSFSRAAGWHAVNLANSVEMNPNTALLPSKILDDGQETSIKPSPTLLCRHAVADAPAFPMKNYATGYIAYPSKDLP